MFLFILLALIACSSEANVYGDVKESKIIVDEERKTLNFYALIKNDSQKDTGNLFAKFIIQNEDLKKALGSGELEFSDKQDKPISFSISANSGYFITFSNYYDAQLPPDELKGAVDVVIYDENEKEVTRFTIQNVTSQ